MGNALDLLSDVASAVNSHFGEAVTFRGVSYSLAIKRGVGTPGESGERKGGRDFLPRGESEIHLPKTLAIPKAQEIITGDGEVHRIQFVNPSATHWICFCKLTQ